MGRDDGSGCWRIRPSWNVGFENCFASLILEEDNIAFVFYKGTLRE
jgi:hypothetical protein